MWKMRREIWLSQHPQCSKCRQDPRRKDSPQVLSQERMGGTIPSECASSFIKNENTWLGLHIAGWPRATGLSSLVLSFFVSKMEIIKPVLRTAFSSLCILFFSKWYRREALSSPFLKSISTSPQEHRVLFSFPKSCLTSSHPVFCSKKEEVHFGIVCSVHGGSG